MNRRSDLTAADVLNSYTEEQLADVFYLYGELRQARRIASAVVRTRQQHSLLTTGDLLKVAAPFLSASGKGQRRRPLPGVGTEVGLAGEKKEAARLFQSLRIEVNHEMEALKELLAAAVSLLKPGGRLSVITYHSLEDRIVKNFMRAGNAEGQVTQDFFGHTLAPLRQLGGIITPSEDELQRNPRSRSAKLRIAERGEG
jgi:16S rRNA (cytosine1402-N4)-methyltransferase